MTNETETKPATKSEALRLARRLWGRNVWARVNPHAPGPEERAAIRERSAVRKARRDEIKAALIATPQPARDGSGILEAAKFVADVNGDEPSIPQLREAVAQRVAYLALKAEDADLVEAGKESSGTLFRKYSICLTKGVGGFAFNDTKAEGDTWQEVVDRINGVKT